MRRHQRQAAMLEQQAPGAVFENVLAIHARYAQFAGLLRLRSQQIELRIAVLSDASSPIRGRDARD